MGWLGRRMARHEIMLLSALADLKGLPALAGRGLVGGPLSSAMPWPAITSKAIRSAIASPSTNRFIPRCVPYSTQCMSERSFTSTCTSAKTSS